jgi:hypothetical protein
VCLSAPTPLLEPNDSNQTSFNFPGSKGWPQCRPPDVCRPAPLFRPVRVGKVLALPRHEPDAAGQAREVQEDHQMGVPQLQGVTRGGQDRQHVPGDLVEAQIRLPL